MSERILPILALLMSVGIFFAYINPTWTGQIAATQAAIAADDRALAAAQEYAAQQSKLATERDAIDPKSLATLVTLLPDSADNIGLILDLNALAARSQLSLSNVDVVTNSQNSPQSNVSTAVAALPSSSNPVGSVDISLSAAGTFTALQNFLVGIEKSTRLLDVRDLIVKGSDTNVYGYQMTLRIYWLR